MCGCNSALAGAVRHRAASRDLADDPRRGAALIWRAIAQVAPRDRRVILRRVLERFSRGAADRVEQRVAVLNARGTHVPTAMRVALAEELARGGTGKVVLPARNGGLGLFGPAEVTWPIPIDPFSPYNEGQDGPQWFSARRAYKRVKRAVAARGVWGYPRWGQAAPPFNVGLPYSGRETPPRRRRALQGLGYADPRSAGEFWPEPPEDRPYVVAPLWDSLSMAVAPPVPGLGQTPEVTFSCDRATGAVGVRFDGGKKIAFGSLPLTVQETLRPQMEAAVGWCADPNKKASAQQKAKTQERIRVAANARADAQYAARMAQYDLSTQLKKGLKDTTETIVGGASSAASSVGTGVLRGLAPLLLPLLAVGLGAMYLLRRASAPVVKVGGA